MAEKHVYSFGAGKADGTSKMKDLLGGKGANLAEMSRIRIPVPPGFTVTTEVCNYYSSHNSKYPAGLTGQVNAALKKAETIMDAKFADKTDPLLFSVRSGAKFSMPGMMDTVLNLGLNDRNIKAFAMAAGGDERFAWDCYRRLIQMYGDVVLEVEKEAFDHIIESAKKKRKVKNDLDLTAADWKEIVKQFKAIIRTKTGKAFPQDPQKQLWGALGAVFSSWNNERAITYRNLNNIPHDLGTAVNVQAMVYGNRGEGSATGVAFTRDAATGEKVFYGEWLPNAQGEDVVAGIRTPMPLRKGKKGSLPSLQEQMPKIYKQLDDIRHKLEAHYKDIQDIEFTIQNNHLWMLQTRTGKRTAQAAVRIAVEMVKEGLIDKEEAVRRIDPDQFEQLFHPSFETGAVRKVVAKGLPASPGAAVGQVVFSAADAEKWAADGKQVILVRVETSPEDIGGMDAAKGILTARGGMTSHAAVVARGMGKCCVAGCDEIEVDYKKKLFKAGKKTIKQGTWISLDGSAGEVMEGKVPTQDPELSKEYYVLMKWADQIRTMKVRTNADTPEDARVAREFGAEGIGLTRTEHMFFEAERITAVREMILATTEKDRRKALKKLLPMQRKDFEGIFKAMDGLPVTIRLLDPPLHEFLPHEEDAQKVIAKELGVKPAEIKRLTESLSEFNPMLGHRGCRLAITYPEICEMQAQAIMEAACNMQKKGIKVLPEIMVPLIGTEHEFNILKVVIDRVAREVIEKKGIKVKYMVGTMIEIPRACLVADKVAQQAEFFSYGTNDLTQMAYGYSRDDSGRFLADYVENGILAGDPFQSLDQEGVGQLVETGVRLGRSVNPKLKIGVCGEHGGDPASVVFFHNVGLDYVSCSPYRVPIARLAAAQAVLEEKQVSWRDK